MERLLPDPGPTTIADQLGAYRPWEDPPADRPHVALNLAATLDGRGAIDGESGAIGTDTDTEMLGGLRHRFDAVLIGAGTMRSEHYGRLVADDDQLRRREERGLGPDPLLVILGGLDLPWDAPAFTDGGGRVLIVTAETGDPPATATTVEVLHEPEEIDLARTLAHLRREQGVEALLCEGGPHLHSELQARDLADELFLTIAPKLVGVGSAILEGELPEVVELELTWLLREGSELFARYRRGR